jgi:hypothetical protein
MLALAQWSGVHLRVESARCDKTEKLLDDGPSVSTSFQRGAEAAVQIAQRPSLPNAWSHRRQLRVLEIDASGATRPIPAHTTVFRPWMLGRPK